MIWNIGLVVTLFISASSSASFPVPSIERIHEPRDGLVSYRLPTDTIPINYSVTLEPFFVPDFIFKGEVTILIKAVKNTRRVTLHTNRLTIESVTVKLESGTNIYANHSVKAKLHFIFIDLNRDVVAGTRLGVHITYQGILNAKNEGFYRASYQEKGVTKWFGTTQFQATNARQAFPCYDEPALKATFIINLIRSSQYSSLSNMDLLRTESTASGKFKDTFEETVVMSTYLVAFVVSEFICVEKGTQKVYGAPELINDKRGDYGLDAGIKILDAVENFASIQYHLSKLYHVAIPNDWFWAGAMENWGLVTYKERYIFYKDGLSTAREKETVASIISHEVGHQWFGNLVSPTWWEYLWLNEGFATYFGYYATNVVEPDMRMMDQFVTIAHQGSMESDALITTRPMNYDVQSPAAILSVFDKIAYDKSGAVLRMVEHFLSTSVFRRGLNTYLTARQFAAAMPSDLWDGLQGSANLIGSLQGLTVKEIMDTWTNNAGYPVVYVKKKNGAIVLSQFRFLLLNNTDSLESSWIIPINYATSTKPDFSDTSVTYWLKSESETTNIAINDDEWIIINKQSTGYYRVNYDVDNWNMIINYLNSKNFNNIQLLNKAQLIDDALNLARSGRLDYSIAMNLLTYLSQETDYIPFYSFFRGLTFLNKHFVNTADYEIFKHFVRGLLQTVYENLGPEDNGSHTDRLNRIDVLTWLCRFEDESCLEETHRKLISGKIISPDLQAPVYCGGLISENADIVKWLMLYGRYKGNVAESLEKSRIVSALSCARSETLLSRLLNMITDNDNYLYLSSSDKMRAFAGVYSSSKIGLDTAFSYLMNNFGKIRSKLSVWQISTMIIGISDRLTTKAQKIQLDTFKDSLSADMQAEFNNTFKAASKNIQRNIDWAEQHLGSIRSWFEDYYNEVETTTKQADSGLIYTVRLHLLAAAVLSHIFRIN